MELQQMKAVGTRTGEAPQMHRCECSHCGHALLHFLDMEIDDREEPEFFGFVDGNPVLKCPNCLEPL